MARRRKKNHVVYDGGIIWDFNIFLNRKGRRGNTQSPQNILANFAKKLCAFAVKNKNTRNAGVLLISHQRISLLRFRHHFLHFGDHALHHSFNTGF